MMEILPELAHAPSPLEFKWRIKINKARIFSSEMAMSLL